MHLNMGEILMHCIHLSNKCSLYSLSVSCQQIKLSSPSSLLCYSMKSGFVQDVYDALLKQQTYTSLILSSILHFMLKPLTQTRLHSLLSSIHHHFFPCTDNKVNLVWRRNNYSGSVTDRSAECLSSCESMPGF